MPQILSYSEDDDTVALIDSMAEKHGVPSRSEMLRRLVRAGLTSLVPVPFEFHPPANSGVPYVSDALVGSPLMFPHERRELPPIPATTPRCEGTELPPVKETPQ